MQTRKLQSNLRTSWLRTLHGKNVNYISLKSVQSMECF